MYILMLTFIDFIKLSYEAKKYHRLAMIFHRTTGYHFTGPLALRHMVSQALPSIFNA